MLLVACCLLCAVTAVAATNAVGVVAGLVLVFVIAAVVLVVRAALILSLSFWLFQFLADLAALPLLMLHGGL